MDIETCLTERSDQMGTCGNWRAWYNRMPGQPPTLHVQGQCHFPTTGYKTELRRASPQGPNPGVLLLDLLILEPSGPVLEVATTGQAWYEEMTDWRYEQVEIRPDDVTVDVLEVS
jgi:hypothetical protein